MNYLSTVNVPSVLIALTIIGLVFVGARFAWGVLVTVVEEIVMETRGGVIVDDAVMRDLSNLKTEVILINDRIKVEVDQVHRMFDTYLGDATVSVKRKVGRPRKRLQ
jgi:hypothetical protein